MEKNILNFSGKRFFEVLKPGYIYFIFAGVFIDLFTKYLIILNYQYHESREIMGDFFRLSLTFNTGFVFGLFQDNAIPSLIATSIAIVVLLLYRWKNHDLGNPWGWNFVMIGAIGNLIDKFFIKIPGIGFKFGFHPGSGEFIGVVDFLDFDWPDFLLFSRWPAFNVADSCVTIGLVILLLTMETNQEKK